MRAPLLSLLAASSIAASAYAQSTAFTYQGRLKNGAALSTGSHDFRFRLYDAPAAGTQIGAGLCADNIALSEGLFTVDLDFGAVFTGQPRFLEIDVRTDTGLNCANPAGFVLLGPRQEITATPSALFSLAAVSATTATNSTQLNGQPASFYTSAANLTGTLPSTTLSGTYAGALNFSSVANSFAGSGASLSNLNASNLATGTVAEARLPTGLPRLNAANAFGSFTNSFLGNVGIGTASPTARLDVRGGAMLVENLGDQADLLWLSSERSWVFRQDGTGSAAALKLESVGGGGNKNLFISTDGVVIINGIGNSGTPFARLHVFSSASQAGPPIGIRGQSTGGTNPVGVSGIASGTNSVGVTGSGNLFGIQCFGNFSVSGTKSFYIDHPFDPANKYLVHYCAESNEVINFYRGTVALDAAGEAVVALPPYFGAINRDPSYTLTAVGSAMPTLHVAERIRAEALAAGARAEPGEAAPLCTFRIAGGAPRGEVSWRVDAVRNDPWVQQRGAPVEVDKTASERGSYQHPELYGQPESMQTERRGSPEQRLPHQNLPAARVASEP